MGFVVRGDHAKVYARAYTLLCINDEEGWGASQVVNYEFSFGVLFFMAAIIDMWGCGRELGNPLRRHSE